MREGRIVGKTRDKSRKRKKMMRERERESGVLKIRDRKSYLQNWENEAKKEKIQKTRK